MLNILRHRDLFRRSVFFIVMAVAAASGSAQTSRLKVCSEDHPAGCDKAGLQKSFRDAPVIGLETHPADRMANGQLTEMVRGFGKAVSEPGNAPGTAPAVTLALQRLNTDGVLIGPAGAALATLTVYGPARDGERGTLLWSETYTGQPDMSWPATVHALLMQFQAQALKP